MGNKLSGKVLINLAAVLLLLTFLSFNGAAAVPTTINYQGYLTDSSGGPLSGTVTMKFVLYDAVIAGNAVWNETQSVTVTNGVYNAIIGAVTQGGITLPFDRQYFLGVTINADAEMTPREPLTSVGYSFRAGAADSVTDGVYATGSYADPSWITSLAGNKISGDISGNAANVTGVVAVANGGTGSSTKNFVSLSGDTMTGILMVPSLVSNGTTTIAGNAIMSGNVELAATTAATGIIKSGTDTLLHSYGTGNFFAGLNAGNLIMSGGYNTGLGPGALAVNTSGSNNFANGYASLNNNTTGNSNTAAGAYSLYLNTAGSSNTAAGHHALYFNTTGSANTATGGSALYFNSIGNNNTADGQTALYHNTTASKNTALGTFALYSQSYDNGGTAWDSFNTGVGFEALYSNQSTSTANGIQNTAVGSQALKANTTGYGNMASGAQALSSNTTGNDNTAGGYKALYSNNTAGKNTAFGSNALYTQSYSNGGTAYDSYNTAMGFEAMFSNQPTATSYGSYNTAVGGQSLRSNTYAYHNSALGYSSLFNNTSGSHNTAIGASSLYSNQTSANNTAIGDDALYYTTGSGNTAIGSSAGTYQTTGSNNIAIGYNVIGVAGESNTIRIGYGSTATYVSGISGQATTGGAGAAVYVSSDGKLGTAISSKRFKEDIQDMGDATNGLMKLRPVTFLYKPEYANGSRLLQYGLIAEEVAEVYPDLVQYNDKGEPNTVYYQFVNAMLLNEVQKQHRRIEDLEERLTRLEALMK